MSTGVPYAWEIWAQGPDGGSGISYGTRVVTFEARAGRAPITTAQAPLNSYSTGSPILEVPSRSEH